MELSVQNDLLDPSISGVEASNSKDLYNPYLNPY